VAGADPRSTDADAALRAAAGRPMVAEPALERAAIRDAHAGIPRVFCDSPQYVHEVLSAQAGRPVIVKVETVNPIGAFKGRGTWTGLRALLERGAVGEGRPVVVASTGNFGQGVAYAARAHGVPAIVYADRQANPLKMDRIRRFGATVVLHGRDFDEAREAGQARAFDEGLTFLLDGDEPAIAAGNGTLAIELTDTAERGDLPSLANVYVPVGNGSLIIGVGAWLRAAAPGCRVVGINSDAAPSMTYSWLEGRHIETSSAATAAEGIATRVPVPRALRLMDGRVDAMMVVAERRLDAARRQLTSALGVTVEHSAAAAWLGLLDDRDPRPGASVLLITGSNVAAP
jgi:threonine dehydratase